MAGQGFLHEPWTISTFLAFLWVPLRSNQPHFRNQSTLRVFGITRNYSRPVGKRFSWEKCRHHLIGICCSRLVLFYFYYPNIYAPIMSGTNASVSLVLSWSDPQKNGSFINFYFIMPFFQLPEIVSWVRHTSPAVLTMSKFYLLSFLTLARCLGTF